MDAKTPESLILVAREGASSHITLNRQRAINALNTEMFEGLKQGLEESAGANVIVLDGTGERGFCGGGDVKQIAQGGDARALFGAEYRVDYQVHVSAVPVVALMDGVAMGGGIGLGGHAAFRVVTERSRLAMPEVRIGIAPDVGGHLLLARAPGRLGEYLAITAQEMSAADAIALGFADTLVSSARLDELRAALAAGGDPEATLAEFAEPVPEAPLLSVRAWFDAIADAALSEIDATVDPVGAASYLLRLLEESELEVARDTAAIVRTMCPISVVLTVSQIARTRAEGLDLAGVLEDDFRVIPRLAQAPNFIEGVRAQLIDRDQNPVWVPARIEDVDPREVSTVLAPHSAGDAPLGLLPEAAH